MNKLRTEELVIECIKRQLSSEQSDVVLNKDTQLIGTNRILDSMGLVSLLIDIETALNEEDIDVSIMSENAMSFKVSPFRTIGSLINYIDELIKL